MEGNFFFLILKAMGIDQIHCKRKQKGMEGDRQIKRILTTELQYLGMHIWMTETHYRCSSIYHEATDKPTTNQK
jgi:hypothetical protein